MNNTQLYLATGLPTLASFATLTTVIIGWFLSRADNNRLSDKLDAMTAKLNERMDAINKTHHEGMKMLMGYMVPLHERMAKLESRD